jgi:uncharacterized protein YbjT (DUF2867 family)
MTRILVIGATGTTGRPVFELLSEQRDVEVMGTSRFGENKPGGGTRMAKFNYFETETIRAALQGIDKVFLVTPFIQNMQEMEKAVIDELCNSSVKHVVKLSVFGADAEDGITIGKVHRQLEKEIEQSGISYTFLRPMYFMQNYANFTAHTIKTQKAFYMPTGEGKVSIVDTRDIAAVAVKALTEAGHEGKAYSLTGPQALSNHEVADVFSTLTGHKIKFVDVKPELSKEAMISAGMSDWNSDRMLEFYNISKLGYTATVTNEIGTITGNRPRSFKQFAEDFKEAFI